MRVEAQLARFVREHPGWVDAAVVGFALFISFSSMYYVAELAGWPLTALLNGVPPLILARRRQAPRVVLALVLGFGLLQWGLAIPTNGVQATALIALYTVARHDSRSGSRVALGAALAMVAIAPLRQPFFGPGNLALATGLTVVVYLIGTNIGLRQGYLQALEERAERLERERDAAAEVAAVLERTRIARELHDVVAHHVSVMVVQAEGAGWAIDGRPEQARTAVATIAETGRTTLIELRRLLGVLRAGDEDGVAPQPGLADLPALVEGFRGSGLSVVHNQVPAQEVEGELLRLPDSLQLAVFRIVQEGLTNVLKHAGQAARAQVEVQIVGRSASGSAELVVEIQDDGIGMPAARLPGHGLIGIRERVALFGGSAEIGPVAGGGFRVRAGFPIGGRP
jgi:signal transduction histidine kinase